MSERRLKLVPMPTYPWASLALKELRLGYHCYGAYNSTHEAAAVIREEFDEFWERVKADDCSLAVEEALQVAATALRFCAEYGDPAGVRGWMAQRYRAKTGAECFDKVVTNEELPDDPEERARERALNHIANTLESLRGEIGDGRPEILSHTLGSVDHLISVARGDVRFRGDVIPVEAS